MKICPFCAEEIQSEAIKCKHCGEFLAQGSSNQTEKGDPPPLPGSKLTDPTSLPRVEKPGPPRLPGAEVDKRMPPSKPSRGPLFWVAASLVFLAAIWIILLSTSAIWTEHEQRKLEGLADSMVQEAETLWVNNKYEEAIAILEDARALDYLSSVQSSKVESALKTYVSSHQERRLEGVLDEVSGHIEKQNVQLALETLSSISQYPNAPSYEPAHGFYEKFQRISDGAFLGSYLADMDEDHWMALSKSETVEKRSYFEEPMLNAVLAIILQERLSELPSLRKMELERRRFESDKRELAFQKEKEERAREAKEAQASEERKREESMGSVSNRLFAYSIAEDFIVKQLKAPRTAKFPGWFSGKEDHVKYLGNNKYAIRSYVDSQNGFGALIRSQFYVEIERSSELTWRLLKITIE